MRSFILLVFCYHVVSQPVTDESTRHTRELIECCPCPGSNRGSELGRSQLRASVDDCPCRSRSADSEGASSIFFPRTAGRPDNSVPFMRSNDPNDIKNLLEPEVGLATSMLQTLREATEEEYRDALARDAARSSDAVPEESANVVIIVKPRASDNDQFVSEASNVKEARYNPVGPSLGKIRTVSKPLRTLTDLFKLPKARQPGLQRNLWNMDSNVGASNVQPSVVENNGETEFKPLAPLFKLRTPLKENPLKSSINGDSSKAPTVFDKLEQTFRNSQNLFERFNFSLIPKMKVDKPLRKVNNINRNNDLSPAPSNIQNLLEKNDDKGLFKLNKRPLMLKNLLKLKDVEIIPKTMRKLPTFKSRLNSKDLSLPTSLNKDADENCEDSNYDSAMNEKELMPKMAAPTAIENIELDTFIRGPQNIVNTVDEPEQDKDIQDAITSPSEIVPNILDNTQTVNVQQPETGCKEMLSEKIMTTTEIISEVDGSNEKLDPEVESEVFELTENENDGSASKGCDTDEVLENQNEVSEPDMDSSNNIGNIIPFTTENSEDFIVLPQLKKPEQAIIKPTENCIEVFDDVRSAEEKTQRIETKPEVISQKFILDVTSDNERQSTENTEITTQNVVPSLSTENSKSSYLEIDAPITADLDQEPRKDDWIRQTDDSNSNEKENIHQVTINDLQKLSDNLLVLSSNKEQNIIPKEVKAVDGSREPEFPKSNVAHQQTEFNYLESETSNEGTLKNANIYPLKEKACRVTFDENKTKQKPVLQFKSAIQEQSKDMSVEANSPVANTLPALLDPLNLNEKLGTSLLPDLDPLNLSEKLRSPVFPDIDPLNLNEKLVSPILSNLDNLNSNLRSSIIDPLNLNEKWESLLKPNLDPLNVRSSIQNIIVQPSIPNDPLNILGKPISEVFKLPTLEDLRQRLSSVFETNDRSAENNFSDEEGDYTNNAPVEMVPAASTSNLRKVPSIRPLEDMNVDIFQLNPLSKPNLMSNAPRLNLNNFRAKLPIPNNLDLKPVKLESRVGNNKGNVLGASLTFGNDKATLRNAKPNSNIASLPLRSFPSLDELRNTFHSSTKNLLSTPLHTNLDLFKDSNLRASGIPDIDDIRRNAEKTLKSLQQRMKSTFKGNFNNPLTEKFARPQDLLEDVNDKIKAIHIDLNDRLSSIHEDILDQSRLKPLAIPVRPTFPTSRNTNKNIMTSFRKTKGKPARLQTSASTISSQEINPFESTNDKSELRSPARNNPRIQSNTHRKLFGAESSPVAKVEFPNTNTSIDNPRQTTLPSLPRLSSLKQGSESLFPHNSRGKPLALPKQTSFIKDLKRPIFKKPNPFKDTNSKVIISFSTTTAKPITLPVNQFRTTPSLKTAKPGVNIKPNSESLALLNPITFGDAKQSASKLTPSEISTPFNSKTNFKTANSDKNHPQLQSLERIENKKLKTKLPFKEFKDSKLRLNENNAKKLDSSWAFDNSKPETKNAEVTEKKASSLVWPKSGEDSFLTKVREAMQARLKSFNPNVGIPKVEKTNTDMIRSASENNDVILEEPIKENVPYKCRMLCSRE